MTPAQTLLELFEPRAIMAVGCCFAFLITCLLLVHVRLAKAYRNTLVALSLAMGLACVGMALTILQFFANQTLPAVLAPILGALAYFFGSLSVVLLYRPDFPKSLLTACAIVCLLGFSLCTDVASTRNWSNLCQFVLAGMTALVLLRTPDPLAPGLRRVCFALSLFAMFGLAPHLIAVMTGGADAMSTLVPADTTAYRIRALVWTLSPALMYASVTSVIQSRISRRLRNTAEIDVLTGAFTRRYLFEAGEQALKNATDIATTPPTILLIDVDHFKAFNDNWGHSLGDDVLRHCVECIRKVVRSTDAVIGRYGGEEFCVLLPGMSAAAAQSLAERVRAQIADTPYRQGDQVMAITVSIGVAQHRQYGSLNSMINLADERLYRAKHGGRNCVVGDGNQLVPA